MYSSPHVKCSQERLWGKQMRSNHVPCSLATVSGTTVSAKRVLGSTDIAHQRPSWRLSLTAIVYQVPADIVRTSASNLADSGNFARLSTAAAGRSASANPAPFSRFMSVVVRKLSARDQRRTLNYKCHFLFFFFAGDDALNRKEKERFEAALREHSFVYGFSFPWGLLTLRWAYRFLLARCCSRRDIVGHVPVVFRIAGFCGGDLEETGPYLYPSCNFPGSFQPLSRTVFVSPRQFS